MPIPSSLRRTPAAQASHTEYVKLEFEVKEEWLDLLSLALSECGCLGTEFREGQRNGQTHVLAYFHEHAPTGSVVERLQPWLRTYDVQEVHWLRVPDQDWNALWRSTYRPIDIGVKLTVLPSWSRKNSGDRLVVRIKPDFAFGTGSHETTRLCLEALTTLPLAGRQVADVGTGSAILSIAAARLGAAHVFACDPDPLALTNARHNVRLNRVTHLIDLHEGELSTLPAARFDVILANLVLEPLRDGVAALRKGCRPGADVIVSGLLASQEPEWLPLALREGFQLVGRRCENDWLRLHLSWPNHGSMS